MNFGILLTFELQIIIFLYCVCVLLIFLNGFNQKLVKKTQINIIAYPFNTKKMSSSPREYFFLVFGFTFYVIQSYHDIIITQPITKSC